MPRPVHGVQEATQLVPKQEQAVGIVVQQLAELLHGRVVDQVPLLHRRRVPRRPLKGLPEGLRRLLVRDGVAQPPGQIVAPRFLLGEAKVLGEELLLIPGVGVGDQPTQGAEGFGEGRAFHDARRAHGEPPEVGHHGPVVLALRADRDLPPDERGRGHHDAHGDEVGWALDAVGDVGDPGRERGG